MDLAAEIPLFQELSRFDLARIAGEWHELTPEVGTRLELPPGPSLLFVLSGSLQVEWVDGDQSLPCLTLRTGDFWKEEEGERWALTAGQGCQVGLISWSRMQQLLQSNPQLTKRFLSLVSDQRLLLVTELGKARQMLKAYAHEIWNQVQPVDVMQAAGNNAASPPLPIVTALPTGWHERIRLLMTLVHAHAIRWGSLAISFALGALIYRYVPLPKPAAVMTAVLVGASLHWFMNLFPDWAVALAATTLLAVSSVISPSVALGGFANPSWFLLLGVLGLGAGVARTGFLYRAALIMLARLPPTYIGQSLALALTGLLLTPVLPSSNSRCALASPLTLELVHAMGLKPRSKGAAGLGLTAFLSFGQMYFSFLSGANLCLLAWSLMPAFARAEITWLRWFVLVLPLTILVFSGCFLTTLWLYAPESSKPVLRTTVQNQLAVLGPLTKMERTALGTSLMVLIGFMTQEVHGINPAWIAMAGFLFLVATGVVDKETLRRMDWGFLLLIGALVGLSDATTATGLVDRLSALLSPLLAPIAHQPVLFLTAVGLMTILVRLAIPLQQTVMLMVMAMLPVGMSIGYHPIVIVLTILGLSNTWILPQINQMYLTVLSGTEEQTFSHQQARPLSFLHLLIGFASLFVTVPYWSLFGLLPR